MPVFRQPTLWAARVRSVVSRSGGKTRIRNGGLRRNTARFMIGGDRWTQKTSGKGLMRLFK